MLAKTPRPAVHPSGCCEGIAFEGVLAELGLTNRGDPLCELVAAKVIELGQQGVHDSKQLHELALAAIKTSPTNPPT